MSKKIIVILCSVIIVLAGAMLVFGVTLSVDEYRLSGTLYSDEAKAEAEKAHETLDEKLGTNLFLVNEDEVKAVFDEYPYLSVVSVEKVFPKRIEIVVEEKMELFAVPYMTSMSTGYAMVDENGLILSIKGMNTNRLDGGENVLLSSVTVVDPVIGQNIAESKVLIGGTENPSAFKRASEVIGTFHYGVKGLRSCVLSVSVFAPTSSPVDEYIVFTTSEGVSVEIYNPEHNGTDKAKAALSRYLSLNDTQKLFGRIFVTDDKEKEGGFICSYTMKESAAS